MKKLTHKEVYKNRLRWINYLFQKNTLKYKHTLENVDNPAERGCLGHGCHVLEIPRVIKGVFNNEAQVYYGYDYEHASNTSSPKSFINSVLLNHADGMFNIPKSFKMRVFQEGDTKSYIENYYDIKNLVEFNDGTEASPLQIGMFLKNNIMGRGKHSPLAPIKLKSSDKKRITHEVLNS